MIDLGVTERLRAATELRGLAENSLHTLASMGSIGSIPAGATLTRPGEKVDRVVFVLSGEIASSDGASGAMFGVSAVSSEVESIGLRAVSRLEIVSWDRAAIEGLEEREPGLLAQLAIRLSLRGRRGEIVRRLRQTRIFQAVSPFLLQRMIEGTTLALFEAGEEICRQDEIGDAIFHLVTGEVGLIHVDAAGVPRALGTLVTGSTFGEMSLLSGAPRNATVVTLRDSEVLIIPRSDVESILRESRSFREALRAMADERLSDGLAHVPQVAWLVNRTTFSSSTLAQLLAAALEKNNDARVLLVSLDAGTRTRAEETLSRGVRRLWLPRDDRAAALLAAAARNVDFALLFADPAAEGAPDEAIAEAPIAEAITSAFFLSFDPSAPFPYTSLRKRVTYVQVRATRYTASAPVTRRDTVRLRLDADPTSLAPSLEEARWDVREAIARLARAVARCRVGLALAGGAAWGFAHVALLRGIQRERIPIDMIAGVSFGSVVGVLLASRSFEALDIIAGCGPDVARIAALAPVSTRQMEKFLLKNLHHRTLEELDTACLPVAVDIDSGEERVFRTGPIAPAVRASCSLPGIFTPMLYDGGRFVDGCVANNVPSSALIDEGADFIVASNIVPRPPRRTSASPKSRFGRLSEELSPIGRVRDVVRSMFLMFNVAGTHHSADTDVTFTPHMDFLPTDFFKAADIIRAAEPQVEPVLADIRERYLALTSGNKAKR